MKSQAIASTIIMALVITVFTQAMMELNSTVSKISRPNPIILALKK